MAALPAAVSRTAFRQGLLKSLNPIVTYVVASIEFYFVCHTYPPGFFVPLRRQLVRIDVAKVEAGDPQPDHGLAELPVT